MDQQIAVNLQDVFPKNDQEGTPVPIESYRDEMVRIVDLAEEVHSLWPNRNALKKLLNEVIKSGRKLKIIDGCQEIP